LSPGPPSAVTESRWARYRLVTAAYPQVFGGG
jgi:hypothetical protein